MQPVMRAVLYGSYNTRYSWVATVLANGLVPSCLMDIGNRHAITADMGLSELSKSFPSILSFLDVIVPLIGIYVTRVSRG